MQKIHNKLMKKNKLYAKWHDNPLSNFTHFVVFVVTALLLTSLIQNQASAITTTATVGGPNTLDIVFIGDNYDPTELGKFHNDVERFKTEFLKFEPFKSRASQITFDYVDNTNTDLKCDFYIPNLPQRLACKGSTTANQMVISAGKVRDYIVVIVDTPTYGGGSAVLDHTVAFRGGNDNDILGPRMFIHEFAHKFGGLADEYTGSGSDGGDGGNCTVTVPLAKWAGLVPLDKYFKGCINDTKYRSSETSIMKSLSQSYFNAISQRQLNVKMDYVVNNSNFSGPNSWENIDTVAPAVGVITTSGTTGNITVSAPMSDNYGIAYYQLWVDGVLKQVNYQGNSFVWNSTDVTNGNHTLQIKAYDTARRVGVSPIKTITTSNDGVVPTPPASDPTTPDVTAPAVTITSPADGSTLSSSVTLTASASDTVGVTKVEFYVNGSKVYSDTSSPFSSGSLSTGSLSNGSHTISAKAYDAAGNIGTSQVTVTKGTTSTQTTSTSEPTTDSETTSSSPSSVESTPTPEATPTSTADTTAPTVSITRPTSGSIVTGKIVIGADASDDSGTVAKVEFYKNGKLYYPDRTSPFTVSWATTNESNGEYTLMAKAYDATGNVSTSDTVTVTVSNLLNTSNVFDAINNWFKKLLSWWW